MHARPTFSFLSLHLFSVFLVPCFSVLHFWLFSLALKPLIILKCQRFIFPIYISFIWFSLFGSLYLVDFPGGSDGNVSAYNAEDPGSIPVSGRSSGEGNGNLLHYSCLENPINRGAWWATVHRVTKIRT